MAAFAKVAGCCLAVLLDMLYLRYMDADEYNKRIVLREARDMAGLLSLLTRIDDGAYIVIDMIKFACFYVNEMLAFFGYSGEELKYRKCYEKTRNKMKPFGSIDDLEKTTTKYYNLAQERFVLKAKPFCRFLTKDVGLFYCSGMIISNTIGAHMENSHIIGKDLSVIDKKKIIDISREIGTYLSSVGGGVTTVECLKDVAIRTVDRRIMSKMKPLFRRDYMVADSLVLLNALCSVNYCLQIVLNNSCQELRIRLCYLVLNKTLADLAIINSVLPVRGLDKILDENKIFVDDTQKLRNNMFHMNFSDDLGGDFDASKLFGGLIEKCTKMSDKEFLEKILQCLKDISCILSTEVVIAR